MCRERRRLLDDVLYVVGSSPRVQGTQIIPPATQWEARFIPACAGNADCRSIAGSKLTVHPRVCRERRLKRVSRWRYTGSSPRVQGTHSMIDHWGWGARFIPACAGNASSSVGSSCGSAVHPRVCRERTKPASMTSSIAGSSPRVQGTHEQLTAGRAE